MRGRPNKSTEVVLATLNIFTAKGYGLETWELEEQTGIGVQAIRRALKHPSVLADKEYRKVPGKGKERLQVVYRYQP